MPKEAGKTSIYKHNDNLVHQVDVLFDLFGESGRG